MTKDEIVTALMGEWEVPCALCDVLPAAADLIENQSCGGTRRSRR